jgi:hypothetical protein
MYQNERRLVLYEQFFEQYTSIVEYIKTKYAGFLWRQYTSTVELVKTKYAGFLQRPVFIDYQKEKKSITDKYKNQWDTQFNIFKIISPSYYYEKLHSILIKTLLDPATPEIANRRYLDLLVDVLQKKQDSDYRFGDNYKVVNEEPLFGIDEQGSIDILIHDDEYAIIIENKSNNADDTRNQLAKYYKYVSEVKGLKIFAVVYLVLDPEKRPLFEYYSDEYKDFILEIIKVLNIIPIIDKKGAYDFVHGYLKSCLSFAQEIKNQAASAFIDQLLGLFKYLGGEYMPDGINKALFEKLFESAESISMVKDIVDIYYNSKNYIRLLVSDSVLPALKELGFGEISPGFFGINVAPNINIVWYHDKNAVFGFGFRSNDASAIPEETETILKDLLEENEFKDFLLNFFPWGKELVLKEINSKKFIDVPTQEIKELSKNLAKDLADRYTSLIKKARERLNS